MFKLCALILVLWVGFLSQMAISAEGEIGVNIVTTTQKGTVDVFREDQDQKVTNSLLRLDLQLPTLKKLLDCGHVPRYC